MSHFRAKNKWILDLTLDLKIEYGLGEKRPFLVSHTFGVRIRTEDRRSRPGSDTLAARAFFGSFRSEKVHLPWPVSHKLTKLGLILFNPRRSAE